MVALIEKRLTPNHAHEKESPLSVKVKTALTRAALRAAEFYGENFGPSEGRHTLNNDNYHNSALKHIDRANADRETAEEVSNRLQQSGEYRGTVKVDDLQRVVGELPEVTRIAQDSKYLYTHPGQQVTHTPYPKHK